LLLLLSALIVAGAVAWAGLRVSRSLSRCHDAGDKSLQLMALFAPGLEAAAENPRALLVWQPLAAAARALCPADFARLDQVSGGPFPFSSARVQAAHDRWTADWLAWERTHDAEFKLKALMLQQELGDAAATLHGRARLEAIEREKLDRYQRRYEDYTRAARAIQALLPPKT
jgi:hypothetical protein